MKGEVEYTIRLGPVDRYRHKHIREKWKVVHFRIQYETLIGDKWYHVVRYDAAHGFAHRDLMSRKGQVTKTPILIFNYNDALIFAESDLKANWEIYKERFLRG
ncbi:hypothetical protein KJ997_00750 [bacterium]|nr:hypothetical protein [bacterium]